MHDVLEGRPVGELAVGDSASLSRALERRDIELFALLSGDVNPTHLDDQFARGTPSGKVIAHSLWGGTLISTLLGTRLPGPGTVTLGQQLRFHLPVELGDVLTATVTVTEVRASQCEAVLDCICRNQRGETIISGVAEVSAPIARVHREPVELPDVRMARHERFGWLVRTALKLPALRTAVVFPLSVAALEGAVHAAGSGLIVPVLVGPIGDIRRLAMENGLPLGACEFEPATTPAKAAARAVALARSGSVQALMRGHIGTDELLMAMMARDVGLTTERHMSHACVMDVPAFPRPLILTDGGVHINPSVELKRDIVQNAIDLALALRIVKPKVAILSAVEAIDSRFPSTLDAAALRLMGDRGMINGGIIDGPFALDTAVSEEAARTKGIDSPVAGNADVLLAPGLEAADMLAKQLAILGGADGAGVLLGASVPVVFTSRSSDRRTRVASCALAVLLAAGGTHPSQAAYDER